MRLCSLIQIVCIDNKPERDVGHVRQMTQNKTSGSLVSAHKIARFSFLETDLSGHLEILRTLRNPAAHEAQAKPLDVKKHSIANSQVLTHRVAR